MTDIYLVGVGGQGIITACKIIGQAAIDAGKKVVLSETHGMAQRGGSVVCTARIGGAHGALIPDGEADVVLSFELLETQRATCKISSSTLVLSSRERIIPLSVSTQKLSYPVEDDVVRSLSQVAGGVLMIDANGLAENAGIPISSNVVMVGALAGCGRTELERIHFESAIRSTLPRMVDENLEAFSLGFAEGHKYSD